MNTGHIHRALAYAFLFLGGTLTLALVMRAHTASVMLDEEATHLEASALPAAP